MAMRESSRRLQDGIAKIIRAARRSGMITGRDEIAMGIAVEGFVKKNFRWRFPGSNAPMVEDLPARVERTIECFSRDILVHDGVMKPMCAQLAEWINANYQKVSGQPWRRLGRNFRP